MDGWGSDGNEGMYLLVRYMKYNRVMVEKGGYWTFGSRWLVGQMMVGRRGDCWLGR